MSPLCWSLELWDRKGPGVVPITTLFFLQNCFLTCRGSSGRSVGDSEQTWTWSSSGDEVSGGRWAEPSPAALSLGLCWVSQTSVKCVTSGTEVMWTWVLDKATCREKQRRPGCRLRKRKLMRKKCRDDRQSPGLLVASQLLSQSLCYWSSFTWIMSQRWQRMKPADRSMEQPTKFNERVKEENILLIGRGL